MRKLKLKREWIPWVLVGIAGLLLFLWAVFGEQLGDSEIRFPFDTTDNKTDTPIASDSGRDGMLPLT